VDGVKEIEVKTNGVSPLHRVCLFWGSLRYNGAEHGWPNRGTKYETRTAAVEFLPIKRPCFRPKMWRLTSHMTACEFDRQIHFILNGLMH